ncbi:hypothetical protein ACIRPP_10645 [Streptomyces sp. NPDC101219]|uniref:hypothetical protein n=1 Tax=Streptomyces sp. NPDC101219 TaxID=3366131 RepID=UPI0037F9E5DF
MSNSAEWYCVQLSAIRSRSLFIEKSGLGGSGAGPQSAGMVRPPCACLSWMANNGVPDTVVSAWAGHSDLGFTMRTYVHPDPHSLKAGSEKLAGLLG